MQMLRRSKSPSKAASSSSSSAWSATGSSAVASSSSAAAGPSSYSSSSSRPASPSKPPPSSWRPPSVAGSQAASGIHFDDEVYVDGEGSVAAEARLPGRVAADGVTRADFFDVVLDDEEQGGQLGDALLPWLGSLVTDQAGPSSQTLDDDDDMDNDVGMPRTGSSGSINAIQQRSKTTTSSGSASQGNPARYESMLMELVETERSYVRRLDTLYNRYAKPLRQAARGREGVILPLYEAQRLFGNVGELLGANMAFLQDLEECLREGGWEALKGSVGDIAHRNIACFTCYNEYLSNFEKAKHIEQTQTRTNRLFREFSDSVKHASSTQMGNVSIRELIMEPVQRIPRYKLLLDGMIKALPAEYSAQRGKLEASVLLCSRIASCEVDEKTQRAAVLWSFARNVQGFPAGLFSVHRSFINAIDVEDFPLDTAQTGTPSSLFSPSVGGTAARSVPCTLFLFDDAVLIAKRNSAGTSGKRALRLHDLNRLADEMKTYTEKSGTPSQPARRAELSFRGVSDILDIQACDLGGPDLQLTFRRSPSHIHHEKWTGRPLRQYATVSDPHAAADSPPPRFDKMRFLENLWRAQALFKARRDGSSHVRSAVIPARSEDAEPRRVVYWNVYPRAAYQVEQNKASVAVVCGQALQLGAGPPHAVLRIHSIDEEYGECVYSTRDDDDEYVLPLSDLAQRVRKLQESLRLTPDVAPSTPSAAASHRGRVAAGLESFGRSLFSGTPESIRFGSPRRKGSILSRSSVATGSDVFSQSGRSVSTAGTSVNSRDMLASGTAVDAAGKLLPPGSPKASARVGRHSRTTSAGTVDMLLGGRGVREEARPRPVSVAAWEPRDMREETPMSPPASVLRQRLASPPPNESPSSPPLTRIMANKPSGPRAAPSPAGTPKRKPVPVTDVPYTPTRRVPSTASKRAAPRESDREDEGQLEGSIKRSKAEGAAATTPLGLRTRASPTPRKANASSTSSSSSSSTTSSSLRGRLHRHLARLDESDKENAAHLAALNEETEELRGVASQLSSRTLDELVKRVETWIEESEGRRGETRSLIGKVAGDVEMLLARVEEKERERERDGEQAKAAAAKSEAEARVLRTRCEALQRKCELLTALEKDGRLENAALHTAFNEELDRLYDDAQLTSRDAEVAALREEVKRTKAQRNEAQARCVELEKQGKLQESKLEAWEGVLRGNGLL